MPNRLLIHESIATLPWTVALAEGWVAPPAGWEIERRPDLRRSERRTSHCCLHRRQRC
jgi:hypothetical protein